MNSNHPHDVTGEDLLALHLNELPPTRAAAVRRSLAQDAALAVEFASIAAALDAVTLNARAASPMTLDRATLDRNWQAIRPSLAAITPAPSRWYLPALGAGLLAAAAAITAFLVFTHHPAAPDLTNPTASSPASHNSILTASPGEQANLRPLADHDPDQAFRPDPSFGVYRPKSSNPNNAIRLIAPAYQSTPNSPSAEPLHRQPLTLLPNPSIPPQPQSQPLTANNTQDAPLRSQPTPTINSAKPGASLPGKKHQLHQLDVMLGIGGTFIPEHDSGSTEHRTLSVTYASVLIGSFHQQFRPALGYRISLSYTRPQFAYTYSAPSTIPGYSVSENGSLNSRIFEAAGTYVIQGPHHKRLTTSADAGAALMAFLPSDHADPGASYAFRPAGVLGVNFDYAITSHVGARLGYRAQIFLSPDFRYTGTTIPIVSSLVVDNEPSLGITYTFSKK